MRNDMGKRARHEEECGTMQTQCGAPSSIHNAEPQTQQELQQDPQQTQQEPQSQQEPQQDHNADPQTTQAADHTSHTEELQQELPQDLDHSEPQAQTQHGDADEETPDPFEALYAAETPDPGAPRTWLSRQLARPDCGNIPFTTLLGVFIEPGGTAGDELLVDWASE